MNKSPLIIVDADAIVSLSSRNDAYHKKAKRILKHLTAIQASALFPITAICEATTVLQRKLSSPQAASYVIEQVQAGNFPIQIIDHSFVTTAMGPPQMFTKLFGKTLKR